MFKTIGLDGFGPFRNVTLDLRGQGGESLGYAMVYGENDSGKTFLAEAFGFLRDSVLTMSGGRILMTDRDRVQSGTVHLVPADGQCGISDGALRHMGIGCRGMTLRFVFDESCWDADYTMRFDETGRLVGEELTYKLDERRSKAISVTRVDGSAEVRLAKSVFTDASFADTVRETAGRCWGSHSMLSILHREILDSPEGTLDGRMDTRISGLLTAIDSMSVRSGNGGALPGRFAAMLGGMEAGTMPESEEHLLDAVGMAVEKYFRRLNGDVVAVAYERRRVGDGWIGYHLVFYKRINGAKVAVPVECESSGFRRLLAFFPHLLNCIDGGVSVIDEMDSGVHEKMIRDLMSDALQDVTGQLIMMTHNTSIIEVIPPRNLFVIRIDYEGFRDISSFASIARTQRNNNNRTRYMNGKFDGVPYIGQLGLEEVNENFWAVEG